MARRTNRREYDASGRRALAEQTRARILAAARELFLARGYAATTMPAIAATAEVAIDTVYASVGKKPQLLRLLVERAISGAEVPIPAEERDFVRAIQAEPRAARKIAIYAAALRERLPQLAPLFLVLRDASPQELELAALWREISQRRARNMRTFARDLAATGELRSDLTIEMIADVVWSMNAPEYYLLLVEERGWTPEVFGHWLTEAWCRLLLRAELLPPSSV